MVRIDGFKEYRDKINVVGCEKIFRYMIFMEPEEEKIVPLLLDFSGEVNEVVDVAELKRTFPKKAIDEYEKAFIEFIETNFQRTNSEPFIWRSRCFARRKLSSMRRMTCGPLPRRHW